jgi:hypothetical protein
VKRELKKAADSLCASLKEWKPEWDFSWRFWFSSYKRHGEWLESKRIIGIKFRTVGIDPNRGKWTQFAGFGKDVLLDGIVCPGFGIPRMTCRAIAEEFGVSTERVRQVEQKVLRRLRHPNNASILQKNRVRWASAD